MIGKLLSKLVGDPNEKVLKRLEPLVAEINALEPKFQEMHDDDLSAVTYELKERFEEGLRLKTVAEAKASEARTSESVTRAAGIWPELVMDLRLEAEAEVRRFDMESRAAMEEATRYAEVATTLGLKTVTPWDQNSETDAKPLRIVARETGQDAARVEAETKSLGMEAQAAMKDAASFADSAARSAALWAAGHRALAVRGLGSETQARVSGKFAEGIALDAVRISLSVKSIEEYWATMAQCRGDVTDVESLGDARVAFLDSEELAADVARAAASRYQESEVDAESIEVARAAEQKALRLHTEAKTLESISRATFRVAARDAADAAKGAETVALSAVEQERRARDQGSEDAADLQTIEEEARAALYDAAVLAADASWAAGAVHLLAGTSAEVSRYRGSRTERAFDAETQTATGDATRLQSESATLQTETTKTINQLMDDALPEAFAAIREASKRVLGMRPFDVQLMGAITLHEGKIAEMRTGEGKTLVATLPAYLSALAGQQVHVVTVNDYLAKRDAAWMGALYSFMGLTVGCIQQNGVSLLYDELHTAGAGPEDSQDASSKFALNPDRHLRATESREDVYNCDIVYGTNNEFGFDYLRGNIALTLKERYQLSRHFAIVDEVDNILIDEARTPLIISGPSVERGRDYNLFAGVGGRLVPGVDFEIDEQRKSVSITESGIDKAEKQLGMKDIYSESTDPEVPHLLENAIRAQHLYRRDREYVLRDDEVVLVDEFTGRLMEGRRLSDGLHQAIEAKEKLRVREETSTYATITLQNYFRLYDRLSGMTGTASTEAEELQKIYGLEVTTIPTNRDDRRIDHQDLIYMTEGAKWRALADKIEALYRDGRPILVGTTTIEKSQIISDILKKRRIRHQVLNAHASRHQSESEIIAQAGASATVTVATNMAGRGTDIILGGNPELVQAKAIPPAESSSKRSRKNMPARHAENDGGNERAVAVIDDDESADDVWQAQHDAVVANGGLFVLGTERHESRRIDNQLRGRAARQGDPGETQFYLSAEDDLVRRFGGDRIKGALGMFNWDEDTPVENAMLVKSVENAQQKVEGINFEIRKQLVEYDDVANTQRGVVYEMRDRILSGGEFRQDILGYINHALSRAVDMYLEGDEGDWKTRELQTEIRRYFPIASQLISETAFERKSKREVEADLLQLARRTFSGMGFRDETFKFINDALRRAVRRYLEGVPTDWDVRGLQTEIRHYFPLGSVLATEPDFKYKSKEEIKAELRLNTRRVYSQRVMEFSEETMKTLEQSVLLRVLDRAWVSHLTRIENMRQGIGLQAIGQRDPLVQYRTMSFQLYEQMNQEIRDEVARTILNIAPGLGIVGQRGGNGQLVANQSDGRAVLQRLALAQAARQQSVMAGAQQQQRSSGNGAPVRASDGRRLSRRERRSMEREQKRRAKSGSS